MNDVFFYISEISNNVNNFKEVIQNIFNITILI